MKAGTVIIGGGIIGTCIALGLKERGEDVLVLDAGDPCMGASWGNAGHIAIEQVYPVADASMLPRLPAMLRDPLGPLRIDWRYLPRLAPWGLQALRNMLPANSARSHRALVSINGQSLGAWQRLVDRWQLRSCLQLKGSLLCCEKPETARKLQELGRTLNALGVENRWLERAELHEMEPALGDSQQGGLFHPGTAHVGDLRALALGLLKALTDMGGKVQAHCAVRHALPDGEGGFRLQTERGEIRASRVVLSAGAFSKALARELTGVTVPLDTERGYHLMLPAETGRLRLPLASADRRFVMTPMARGLRLAGTVEYAGFDLPPNMERARHLLPLANGMLHTPLDARDAGEWMGFRPTTADSLPVIDRRGNVLLAFGHHHLGLTQAACTAEIVTALFFDEKPPIDPHPFRLARFA